MKPLTLKIQLLICLIAGVCADNYGQQATNNAQTSGNKKPCDTLFIKGGIFSIGTIKKIEGGELFYNKCSNSTNVTDKTLFHIDVNQVDSVVSGQGSVLDIGKKSNTRKTFYIEGLLGFSPPSMHRLTVQKRQGYAFGLGGSLSAGYQFNSYFGLGIVFKRDLLIDYSSAGINSVLAEYRVHLGAIKVGLNGGFVSQGSFSGEACSAILLDKTKPRTALGISVKYYSKRYFTYGFNVSYSKLPVNEQCTINGKEVFTRQDRDFVAVNFLIGFSLPSGLPTRRF